MTKVRLQPTSARARSLQDLLYGLDAVRDSTPGRDAVTSLEHSLQVATLAAKAGADPELCAVALLHDVFHSVATTTHGEALALALRDRLTCDRFEILWHHTAWQHDAIHHTSRQMTYYDQSWFTDACRLGKWDACSFDPHAEIFPFSVLWQPVLLLLGDV